MARAKGEKAKGEKVADTPLSDEAVQAYLLANPDFLQRHPDLVRHLAPPSRFEDEEEANRVVDMQGFMVSRLQSDLERARDNHDALISSARSNLSSQGQIHQCALAVLDARDFAHFINIVTNELPLILNVDTVTLCVESDARDGASATPGVRAMARGQVDALLGNGTRILLRDRISDSEAVHGPAAGLVASDALARLAVNPKAPLALLAVGSREQDRFHAGQGTELLGFLAGVLERCLGRWLDLPTG
ncbi:MAG: DUF484 family protein [Minwuia sp.]|nr:DUF484 family protein [Minwuia sp.]